MRGLARWSTLFFCSLLSTMVLKAECEYFRVSFKLDKCRAVDQKTLERDYPYEEQGKIPELTEEAPKTFVRVTCDCVFSLKGSDVRCDMDQTIEKSEIFPAEKAESICRRGKSLCQEICPRTHP